MNLILFGPPGSGKGTQSALLSQRFNLTHISTGDLFRFEIKSGTELGTRVKSILDIGALVPDDLTIGLLMRSIKTSSSTGFILDGFPRTENQASALKRILDDHKIVLSAAIFLDVPREELMKRLTGRRTCEKCGHLYNVYFSAPKVDGVCDECGSRLLQRSDDAESIIARRLEAYDQSTAVLRKFYSREGVLREVNAASEQNMVFKEIETYLKNNFSGQF